MTEPSRSGLQRPPSQRLTPERVRSSRFSRTAVGRRGINEDEVAAFVHRVADEIAARDAAEASLRAKVSHYKDSLIRWQRDQSDLRGDDLADVPDPTPRPSVEAVNILSRAQQEADAHVAQTQEYCRRMAEDARDHAQEIVTEAQRRAEAAADVAAADYRSRSGEGHTAEFEALERRLVWARTFLSSLETVETQLRAAREALTFEFDRMAEGR